MQWRYVNGSLVQSSDEVALPAGPSEDPTLIETFRSRDGRVFRLAQHFDRLCAGAPVLGLTLPLTLRDLETAVADVLARNEAPDARLRLTVSAGPDLRTDVTLTATALTGYSPELYERGMHATIADVRRDETSPLSRIKCAAGLHDCVLARERAREAGFDEAIMLNTRGSVAEATVSNVFVVREGRLLTPTIECGALPGVTRAAVINLAHESAFDVDEAEVTLDGLRTSDEAFLTNSVMGVMPLTRLEGTPIGNGDVGPLTTQLSQRYREAVGAIA